MAYKAYLIRQFDYSHENQFFRFFSTQLRKTFHEIDGLHILIGNLSCNGHEFDALFISKGRITVIDFKDYGGNLTFSENNPWRISKDTDFVFVKGGGGIRNPYQQVNAYRHSLIQFLSNRQSVILEPNHENFNLGHISSLVLFHQKVTYDSNDLSQKIKLYFNIADSNNCIAKILDRTSPQLNLSDKEIDKTLNVLDIREENLYDEAQEPSEPVEKEVPHAAVRLELVRKTLANISTTTELDKLIVYYQTLINLERQKEPSVGDKHLYKIDWISVADSIKINLEKSPAFHVLFQRNKSQQFPKNLFIGINFLISGQTLTLLYNVVPIRDIFSHSEVESLIRDFTLFIKPLEDRNYPDELLEELATAISQEDTITEKIETLRSYLNDEIELSANIVLALSEESPFTSQLKSELNKINKENRVNKNSLLEKFLKKQKIDNKIETIDNSDFIQITALNAAQKNAVRYAFNQPLTVVTGPPGTGKTQVVLNILANAVIHNKKVLFASKNNQAVDNVKERLDMLIKEPSFFLRFGSKNAVRETTKPIIHSYVTRIHHHSLRDNSDSITQIRSEIKDKKKIISDCLSKIEKRKIIEINMHDLQHKIKEKENEFSNWISSENGLALNIFIKLPEKDIYSWIEAFNMTKNEIVTKYSGLNKIFFNLFSKKKHAITLVSSFESWPIDLRNLALQQSVNASLSSINNGADIISICIKLVDFLNWGIELKNQKLEFEEIIRQYKEKLLSIKSEVEKMKANQKEIENTIKDSQHSLEQLGTPLLNESIHKRIRDADALEINNFKVYIPDNIPWKNQEIPNFSNATKKFLNTFNIAAITSLSIKSAFPLTNELFDILVIDEASQCDIASAIPLILRAKQLVVIGDPMQLKHITKVQSYEEKYIINTLEIDQNLRLDYVNESLYDYCYNLSIISRSNSVFLEEHFRCHPDIINYSNKAFYQPKLGQELVICTSPDNYSISPNGIFWLNIEGKQEPEKNLNKLEVDKSIALACKLAQKYPDISIGITTPFRDQANALTDQIPTSLRDRIKADSVHRFQGDEKDIMIFSLVISHNSSKHKADWINSRVPYLINVAVTRAKSTLYVVGNASYCKKLPPDSPLGILINHIQEINPIKI